MTNSQDTGKLLPCEKCGATGLHYCTGGQPVHKGWGSSTPTPRERELEAHYRELETATLAEWKKREHLSQYPRGKTVCPTKALGDLAYMVDKLEARYREIALQFIFSQHQPKESVSRKKNDVTPSCGCVFKDIDVPCPDKECKVCQHG